jgi:hypothetical protein
MLGRPPIKQSDAEFAISISFKYPATGDETKSFDEQTLFDFLLHNCRGLDNRSFYLKLKRHGKQAAVHCVTEETFIQIMSLNNRIIICLFEPRFSSLTYKVTLLINLSRIKTAQLAERKVALPAKVLTSPRPSLPAMPRKELFQM